MVFNRKGGWATIFKLVDTAMLTNLRFTFQYRPDTFYNSKCVLEVQICKGAPETVGLEKTLRKRKRKLAEL